jgi:penicillin-binding protein 1A
MGRDGKRQEPKVGDGRRRAGRLDLALTAEDRPSAQVGVPRRRPAHRLDDGRIEPALYSPDADIELDTTDMRSHRPPRARPHPAARPPREALSRDAEEAETMAPTTKDKGRTKAKEKDAARSERRRFSAFRLLRRLVYWGLVAAIWAGIGLTGVVVYYGARLPPTTEWAVPKRPPNIRIVAADGALLGNRGDTGGEAVKLDDLPPYLPAAVVATEDRRFYGHLGLDPIGLARAVYVNLTHQGVAQGGSTITQQLAKNLFLTQDRTIGRKVQEVLLALWLEREYSKKAILEMYLNRVYMGAGAYGVDAAARRYFGKPAKEVSLMEAAMLAGLLKAPSRFAPSRNPDLARDRASTVLALMVDTGAIKPAEREAALKAPRMIFEKPSFGSESYVADWVMDILPSFVAAVDEDIVVETTIDQPLQMMAESALQAGLLTYGAKQDIGEGALVALDPHGAVKALVGGSDYHKTQYNRAVTAKRQPGSAFKPFVYLAAMEAGLTPDTVRVDEPIRIKGWAPKNFTKDYKGPITLRDALAQSINTIAVRLTLEVGPKKVAAVAERLGIASPLQVNASLALGTSEVTPLEIANAYVPFSNGGFRTRSHVIDRIRTAQNRVLYQRSGDDQPARVIEPLHLAEMNTMLSETLTSGSGRRAQIAGWPAGGKTGTSQEGRDSWFVGYTGFLTAAVWLGNDDGSPTKHATGGTVAATIWQRFMADAHRGRTMVEIPGTWRMPRGADQTATGSVPPAAIPAAPADPIGDRLKALGGGGATSSPYPASPYPPVAGPATGSPRPPAAIGGRQPAPNDGLGGFLTRLFGG